MGRTRSYALHKTYNRCIQYKCLVLLWSLSTANPLAHWHNGDCWLPNNLTLNNIAAETHQCGCMCSLGPIKCWRGTSGPPIACPLPRGVILGMSKSVAEPGVLSLARNSWAQLAWVASSATAGARGQWNVCVIHPTNAIIEDSSNSAWPNLCENEYWILKMDPLPHYHRYKIWKHIPDVNNLYIYNNRQNIVLIKFVIHQGRFQN